MNSNFLAKLVDETFDCQSRGETLEGFYNKEKSCFRFILNNLVLDFPENWSFFENLKNDDLSFDRLDLSIFNKENDPLKLIQCFDYKYKSLIFFTQNSRIFLEVITDF